MILFSEEQMNRIISPHISSPLVILQLFLGFEH